MLLHNNETCDNLSTELMKRKTLNLATQFISYWKIDFFFRFEKLMHLITQKFHIAWPTDINAISEGFLDNLFLDVYKYIVFQNMAIIL